MPSSPILMLIAVVFMILVFIGGGIFCLYQYRLYQLTKFSDRWRPWKGTTIGLICLEGGIVFASTNLLTGIFISYPELMSIDFIYIPLFILVYILLILSGCGIWWAGLGLRKYWIEVHEIAVKAARSE
ncbi:MAG: hypothetical protein HWN67_15975 [Candidatus Helarchaeota archaeon]|nr:hypothetical protein [Candidatus Helarchaeota archaeon]